jgi:outer membrane biosynthesis protein TonB
MRRDARFWRNVVLITLVHVAALIALLRWAGASKIESAQEITWLKPSEDTSASVDSPKPEETPTPVEEKPAPPEENQSLPAPAKSEIQLPTATPPPTPSASVTPNPSPKASPKPSPKKKTSPKPSPTPEKKKSKPETTSAKEKENTKKSVAKKGDTKKSEKKSRGTTAKNAGGAAGGTQATAGPSSANAGWYGNMLHDRFYREWMQPTTVVASGAKLSALAKIRIEKDGRISDFRIVRPSGNVVVDESVAAVGKKVTRVDALPAGIGNGSHYDVNINFALNSN